MSKQNYTLDLNSTLNSDNQNKNTILKSPDYQFSELNGDETGDSFMEPVFNLPPDSTEEEETTSFDSTLSVVDSLLTDSLSTDSLLAADTTKVDWREIDSTARLEYFHYHREDEPYVQLEQKKQSKFFVEPSSQYKKRTITIDSTGKYVEIKETIAGQETKTLLRMPLEDYIYLKLALRERKTWEDLGYKYELKESNKDLSKLISSFTDFEIPLPSVGVLSIFGEPKISLKIGGNVQIHGAWRNETTEGVTANRLGNTRNEPDFKQTVQINVNGTIGDKLNINADWNTERTFEYENQLKIKYTGYEDEIIQSIEAGNVSMQTPSLIGGGEALFGVKALFKMGPFSLTTLASQKKGETKEVSVNSGSTSQDFSVRATDYSENHYFISEEYADSTLFRQYFFNPTPQVDGNLEIKEIEVWKSISTISPNLNSSLRYANCYIDLPPLQSGQTKYDDSTYRGDINPVPGEIENGKFVLLQQNVDYTVQPNTGFITFNTSLNQNEIIAVSYKQGPNNIRTGEFLANSTDTVLVLKLVKPKNLQPGYTKAWKLLLKNIYPLGTRNIKKEGFDFKIKYETVGGEAVDELNVNGETIRFLKAFGLDQQGSGGSATSDNVFDWREGFTILPETGEIIFPTLQPFGANIPTALEDKKYQAIYDTTKNAAKKETGPDKWVLTGKSSGGISSTYQLGFNVVENSVKVLLNGRELSAGSDYIVDYNIGQLTIRNEAALVPGADLKITYEQNDLFQLASKTLLGARGLYDFSDKTQLGFTVMNLNQQTLSDKVRIGEEPLSNTIYGLDFKTSADLPFLTKALDYLISTREISTFSFNGEYAYMSPDPNTKKSTISEDGGKSIAYIDDFEGAKKLIPIGINYGGWKDLSPPANLPFLASTDPKVIMEHKAKSFWFNITPSDVVVDSIYGGRKQVARSDQQITVLDYVFLPDTPGVNNGWPEFQPNLEGNWGGMMKLLSSTASDLTDQNIEYMEFWMNIKDAPPDASMYIDLGVISEDLVPYTVGTEYFGVMTEDRNQNDAVDEGEDIGVDFMTDAQERAYFGSTKSDPAGDNFKYQQGSPPSIFDYFNINGTEGNASLTDIGLLPDTEDLNRSGSTETTNSFFRYKVPLDTVKANNPFVVGSLTDKGWVLFRIPLKDTTGGKVGNPSFSNVETIRLFVNGVSQPVHFRMTEFNLVGSQWENQVKDDSILTVGVKSIEDNEDYTSPPGVIRERDRTRPDEQIYANEQSLNLILKDLPDGESRQAFKNLFRPLDVFNYREMKLFVHGDANYNSSSSISYRDPLTGEYSTEVFFRFGTDTSNYYEYRQPVVYNLEPGSSGWASIDIVFSDLTAAKQGIPDSSGIIEIPVPGRPDHYYRVKGNPTLTSVKFLAVGIYNPDNGFNPGPLSGEVWINELRVVGADDSKGWAYQFSTSLKLADLMTVNFNMSQRNPYFHRLSDRFGSRIDSKNWALSTDLDVLKLLPVNMRESNLRINYSHTESFGKPLYIPGTDIKVDQAADQLANSAQDSIGLTPEELRIATQTMSVSNSISSSNIKLKIPTNLWYIRDTWNSLSFGFNYNNSFNRSPTVLRSFNWVWNANMSYAFSFSPDNYIKPAEIPVIGFLFRILNDYKDVKVYFSPQTFSATVSARRNRNSSQTRPTGENTTSEIVSRDFTASRGFNFGWRITEGGLINLSWNYNVSVNSSLAHLLTVRDPAGDLIDRPESEIWNDILGRAGFGKDNQYQQSLDFRTSPRLPSFWDINRFFTITAGYSVGYRWNYDLRQEELGRSAGYSKKVTAGMILRWKSLTEPLFGSDDNNKKGKTIGEGNADKNDTTNVLVTQKESSLFRALNFLKLGIKAVFFDYDNFTFNFSNDNSLSKSGIASKGTGFGNFWGFVQNDKNGPSRAFQLGFSSDVGPRAFKQGTNLSDVFTEKNNFDFKTARPLWEGAKLDITWTVGWSQNKNTTLSEDANGDVIITNVTQTGNLNKSFLTLPSGLPFVDSGIKKVNTLYNPNAEDKRKNLSDAFVQGFESVPFLSKLPLLKSVASYIPRANWRITWDGLEKLFFFKSIAQRVSLDHAYTSSYTEGWKLSSSGNREIQTQRIDYGFSPLVGLNISFGEVFGGTLSSNVKFSSKTSYDLGVTTSNITETSSREIGITANFSKSGFELPLFGVSLKNDIEFLLSYSNSKNSTVRFEMDNFTDTGIPQDGTTRTTIEPRIKYTISSKVTLSVFYKRSSVTPEGAARIPPTTTNEAGLDVNILIQ